jgi:hypothetical protein|tara:strand:+ start:34 stop:1494 length:1461 start_codon:yes stop_codon:yes gene_type:complete
MANTKITSDNLDTLTTLTVDDINIDGSTISDAGDFTLDVGGEISIDSASGVIRLKDGGTQFGSFIESSNNFIVKSQVSDGDLVLMGVDGGSEVSALTFDMSDLGTAYFNSSIVIPDNLMHTGDLNTYIGFPADDNVRIVAGGTEVLRATSTTTTIGSSSYALGNKPLIIRNGTNSIGASYDSLIIAQDDVPTIRLDETQTGQELTLSVGNENSNSAIIGCTGRLVLATNRSAETVGYSVTNSRIIIDSNNVENLLPTIIKSDVSDQLLSLNSTDAGGWNYIGFETSGTRNWYAGMNNTSDFVIGADQANKSVQIVSADFKAPGVIVQTQIARVDNVVGTGDFDIISLTITPKFSDSDMLIHFYTQWSVTTNDGEDWGMKLMRDSTVINGDTVNGFFISGGGVDASDNPLAQTSYGQPNYYVRFASKTDIDQDRSSGTSTITYKIRKVVPAGTSTKSVRFGVDGWTGASAEANRSKIVFMVQEIIPN